MTHFALGNGAIDAFQDSGGARSLWVPKPPAAARGRRRCAAEPGRFARRFRRGRYRRQGPAKKRWKKRRGPGERENRATANDDLGDLGGGLLKTSPSKTSPDVS